MADDRVIIEIELDDGSVAKGFQRVSKQSKKTGKKINKNLSNAFAGLKTKILGLGAALGAAFAFRRAFKNLTEFGTALAEIRTIADNLSQTNEELANSLILISAQFGTSAQAQANAFYQIISAGVTDATKANELLIAANKLAIGGLTSTANAIDILTSAVNAFGQENLSSEKAADILFGTVKLGKTRIEELSSSLGQILPSAAALGVSFEEVGGAVAQLTTRGISTSEAITQLNSVFTALLKKQDTAKKLGPKVASAFTLQALKSKKLTLFLKDLNGALDGSAEKLVKLLGRAEGARAIITLAGDNFEGLGSKIKELETSTGAADRAFQIINKTIAQRLNVSMSTLDAIILTVSRSTSGPLNNSIRTLNSLLGNTLILFTKFPSFTTIAQLALENLALSYVRFLQKIITITTDILPATGLLGSFFKVFGPVAASLLKSQGDLIEASILRIIQQADAAAASAKSLLGPMLEKTKADAEKIIDVVQTATDKINSIMQQGLVNILSASIQQIGRTLVLGVKGFDGFGKAILGIMGDIAIQIGVVLIGIGLGIESLKASLLSLNGGAAIAAGFALIALGGALKALGSGGLGVASGTSGGGAVVEADSNFTDAAPDFEDRQTKVTINVEGTVIDPKTTGLQIAEILQETFDSTGVRIIGIT